MRAETRYTVKTPSIAHRLHFTIEWNEWKIILGRPKSATLSIKAGENPKIKKIKSAYK